MPSWAAIGYRPSSIQCSWPDCGTRSWEPHSSHRNAIVAVNQNFYFDPAKVFMKILYGFFMAYRLLFKAWRVCKSRVCKVNRRARCPHDDDD
jgi:hypothetical protein